MPKKIGLTKNQFLVFEAVVRRGSSLSGPKELGDRLFGKIRSSRVKVEKAIESGLGTIRPIFGSIDINGCFSNKVQTPEEEKKLLKKIKESFSTFEEFEKEMEEFLDKNEA